MRSWGPLLGVVALSGCAPKPATPPVSGTAAATVTAPVDGTIYGAQIDHGTFGVCQEDQDTGTAPRGYVAVQDVLIAGVPTRVERWWLDSTWVSDDFTWTFLYIQGPISYSKRPSPVGTNWTAIKATATGVPTLSAATALPSTGTDTSGSGIDLRLRPRLYAVTQDGGTDVLGWVNGYVYPAGTRNENWVLKQASGGSPGWKVAGSSNPSVTWTFVPHATPLVASPLSANDSKVPPNTLTGWTPVWTDLDGYTIETSTAAVSVPSCP